MKRRVTHRMIDPSEWIEASIEPTAKEVLETRQWRLMGLELKIKRLREVLDVELNFSAADKN